MSHLKTRILKLITDTQWWKAEAADCHAAMMDRAGEVDQLKARVTVLEKEAHHWFTIAQNHAWTIVRLRKEQYRDCTCPRCGYNSREFMDELSRERHHEKSAS